MNGDYDDLDRALMALPLEEPPVGLRDSILAATIYAPPLASIVLRTWEIVLIGTLLAVGSWLAIALAQNEALTSQLVESLEAIVAALAAPTTFMWLACGATVALGASLYGFVPRRVTVRSGHS
jgi:hypothetical protein